MGLGLVISWPLIPVIVTAHQMIPGAEIPLTPPAYKIYRFEVLTGSYVHQAGGSDVDYFSTTITFLF